jgi:two-component system response regulator YesN
MKGHLIKVKHDVFALVASPAPALDEFVTQAKEKARELLGLTLTSVRFGIDAMQTAYGKLHVYGSAGRQEGEGAQLQQHDNAARSKSIQTELMSYILQGKTELLREYLDRFAANVRQLESNDAKIEGLGLAMALAEIGKREFAGADRAEGEGGIAKWISELQPLTRPEEVAAWSAGPIGEFMWQLNSWLSSKNVNLLDKAIRYIENHYSGSCTVHDAAQHVHLSVSYFSNLFKKETGESYTNYLARYRLGKAKILLCNTNMKIAEIAESVGYDDPNYFTTVFRQWFQASPSEYRKQHQA